MMMNNAMVKRIVTSSTAFSCNRASLDAIEEAPQKTLTRMRPAMTINALFFHPPVMFLKISGPKVK